MGGNRKDPWRVQISVNSKKVTVGYFADEEEGARAYDAAALQFRGAAAILNFPEAKAQASSATSSHASKPDAHRKNLAHGRENHHQQQQRQKRGSLGVVHEGGDSAGNHSAHAHGGGGAETVNGVSQEDTAIGQGANNVGEDLQRKQGDVDQSSMSETKGTEKETADGGLPTLIITDGAERVSALQHQSEGDVEEVEFDSARVDDNPQHPHGRQEERAEASDTSKISEHPVSHDSSSTAEENRDVAPTSHIPTTASRNNDQIAFDDVWEDSMEPGERKEGKASGDITGASGEVGGIQSDGLADTESSAIQQQRDDGMLPWSGEGNEHAKHGGQAHEQIQKESCASSSQGAEGGKAKVQSSKYRGESYVPACFSYCSVSSSAR